jgi:NAD(P)-dependent dehydrogenase (short-subunit alcohol dehydrogenase family)
MKDLSLDLRGKNAVVTGASGVIGGAMALALMRHGANISLTYRSNRSAIEVLLDKADSTIRTHSQRVDNKVLEEIEAHASAVKQEFGTIDILVNCAGGHLPGSIANEGTSFFDMDPTIMERNTSFNLYAGCIWPCYHYGRQMAGNSEGGSIVNISSMNAYRPLGGRPSYAAAKAGVANFTQWLACHVAREINNRIRVNCIAPGFFPGPRNRGVMANEDGSLAWRGEKIVARTPMGRLGRPEDIVGTMLFFVSGLSHYVTGTMIPVDGGFTADAGI